MLDDGRFGNEEVVKFIRSVLFNLLFIVCALLLDFLHLVERNGDELAVDLRHGVLSSLLPFTVITVDLALQPIDFLAQVFKQ